MASPRYNSSVKHQMKQHWKQGFSTLCQHGFYLQSCAQLISYWYGLIWLDMACNEHLTDKESETWHFTPKFVWLLMNLFIHDAYAGCISLWKLSCWRVDSAFGIQRTVLFLTTIQCLSSLLVEALSNQKLFSFLSPIVVWSRLSICNHVLLSL